MPPTSAGEQRDWLRFAEIVILFMTGLATLWGAYISRETRSDANKRSVEETRYNMQRDGLRAFVDGYREFATAIYTIRNRLPVDVEEPNKVKAMTAAQMKELAEVTTPIIAAQYSYEGNFRNSLSAWPKEIRNNLVQSASLARQIALCYEAGSFRALDTKEEAEVKEQLNKLCRFMGNKNAAFHDASDKSYALMINEVVESATRLGADPDKTPELPALSNTD